MNLEDLKRVDTIQQYLGSVLAQLVASGRGDIGSIITMCQDAIWAIETAFTNMRHYVEELRRSNAQTLETLATVRAAREQYQAMRRAHERALDDLLRRDETPLEKICRYQQDRLDDIAHILWEARDAIMNYKPLVSVAELIDSAKELASRETPTDGEQHTYDAHAVEKERLMRRRAEEDAKRLEYAVLAAASKAIVLDN